MKKIFSVLFCLISVLHAQMREEIVKDQVASILPSLEGWCSKEKAIKFIDLVVGTKPDVCVEIGVFGGASLFPVASALKFLGKGVVIAIDPWEKNECIKYFDPVLDRADLEWWMRLDMDYVFGSYRSLLKKYGLDDFCITICATSDRAAICCPQIDILHIDGNHSERVSTKDVALYLPLVRSGGYIWLNDALWEQRQEGIDLLMESCDFLKSIDDGNCILFRKR